VSLLFFIEDDDEPHFPVLECSAEVATALIGECFAFEYYLVPPDFSWIVGENHHKCLFAFGEPVASRVAAL
jgi:hypothetical protein